MREDWGIRCRRRVAGLPIDERWRERFVLKVLQKTVNLLRYGHVIKGNTNLNPIRSLSTITGNHGFCWVYRIGQ